ncbi:LPS-assembly protein [Candidatus Kinetoplastibacterium blastocrithidii TCC012E]|uniref:LPS-assembly protein LptD n=1 Tax=Candidatus Kinetoplastidibacterium blastocrithidiae TCC012E TaxID=1208922 RepID=M1M2Z1_9PROT|nr:LPS assembly protein LptD [Candidatus Kinetoplastibacterium blastocrithidii]AFZ83458.1 hypothetical protein CKBE_00269 [Candidatus Kinetoplastibacterium blastocrithidii (ex Strigomonas culicis)]AGF49554.1 LPS-assembly protein [Candidatus Kinetoplastibacterium blastocrithidii TCC012E]
MRFFTSLASIVLCLLTFFSSAHSSDILSKDSQQTSQLYIDEIDRLQTSSTISKFDLPSEDLPLFLISDQINNNDDGSFSFIGNAQFRRMDSVIKGNHIKFYRDNGNIYVDGDVYIRLGNSVLIGSNAFLNLDNVNGYVKDVKFWPGYKEVYGEAERADIISQSTIKLVNVIYSGSEIYDESWHTKSSSVILDFDRNIGKLINSRLYLCNIPILYIPYMSFPIKDEPKSGFLMPAYSLSYGNGYDVVLPYYVNISSYCDATIYSRFLSQRGLILSSDFRYVNDSCYGIINGSYMHKDKITNCDRWHYKFRNCFYIRDNLLLDFDISRASDNYYFRDLFYRYTDVDEKKYLPKIGKLSWTGKYFDGHITLSAYQVLADDIETSFYYHRLPEIHIRYRDCFWSKLGLDLDFNMVKFVRSRYHRNLLYDGGDRLSFYPSINYKMVSDYFYMTPKLGIHLSEYHIKNNNSTYYKSRFTPICSLDGSVSRSDSVDIFKKSFKQTLESKFFYLYIPYSNQEDLPCYDTNLVDFNYQSLFDENAYSGGWDRIADANHITLLLRAKYNDVNSEFERVSISAANRIYLDNRKVCMPGETLCNNNSSILLLSVKASTESDKVFEMSFDYDFYKKNLCKYSTSIKWNPQGLTSIYIAYKYQNDIQDLLNTISISFQWPLSEKLYGVGRLDFLHSCNIEGNKKISIPKFLMGFEYKRDKSWTNRLVFHRYSSFNGNINNALLFQLELRGLGSIGTDMANLLENNIQSYRQLDDVNFSNSIFDTYE